LEIIVRFFEKEHAQEYDKRLTAEGYPGAIIPLLEEHLEDSIKILDIGAGTGFISIPLAEMGKQVTAIEPSSEMLRLFQLKLGQRKLPLKMVKATWEEWSGKKKEAAISIHSLYPMKDPARAVQKMVDNADKILILIRSDSRSRTLSHILRGITGKKSSRRVSADTFDDLLNDLGFMFSRQELVQERITHFTDIDQEIDFYRLHLDVDESYRPRIREEIEKYCSFNEGVYSNKTVFHDVLYTIIKSA
jgi:FkbM family methyltransferase